jgi:hypothetical protein
MKNRKLPPLFIRCALSLVVGLLCGVLLHYLVYRLGLPVRPFVYVAF